MKRVIMTFILALSLLAMSGAAVLAASPAPSNNGQGSQVSAVARAVDYVSGAARGAAVSALAKTHGAEIAAAAKAKGAAAASAGRSQGAAAAGTGKAHKP